MSEHTEHEVEDASRRWIYWVAIALMVVLVVVAVASYRGQKSTERAGENADKLITVIEDAGYVAPDRDVIIGILGDDGGTTCSDPNSALSRATLKSMLFNGGTGPGARPVLAAATSVRGQLAIISVYCPDELEDFQKFIDDLDLNNDLIDG